MSRFFELAAYGKRVLEEGVFSDKEYYKTKQGPEKVLRYKSAPDAVAKGALIGAAIGNRRHPVAGTMIGGMIGSAGYQSHQSHLDKLSKRGAKQINRPEYMKLKAQAKKNK